MASLAAPALILAGCTRRSDPAEPTSTPEPTPTPAPTQAAPTATTAPIASPVGGYQDPTRWAGRTITVATAVAGSVLDAMDAAFFSAFADSTGATVNVETFGRDGMDNVQSQINSGDIQWDVMLIPMGNVLDWANRGLLWGIDFNIVDTQPLYPDLVLQHGIGAMLYATTMMYSVSETNPPASWADFWDLSRWAGTRALRRSPVGTLEFALLADGVPQEALYPLDLERAFASLERLRMSTLFYDDSKQPVELVRTGQVGLAAGWTVRASLPEVASLVKPVWAGGMISADAWVSPRGSENRDVAMSFINFATRAVPTANFSGMQPFGPVNRDAIPLLDPDVAAALPNGSANMEQQFVQNWSYWNEHETAVTAWFNDWLLFPPATPGPEASPAR